MTPPSDGRALLARDHVAAARALALFCFAGGLWLVVPGVVVPGFAGHGLVLVTSLGMGLGVLAVGAVAWTRPARVPSWGLAAVAPATVAMTGMLNIMTADASTGSQLFLLWPVLYAASFTGRRQTAAVLLGVLVVEALVLGMYEPPSQAVVDTLGLLLAYTMAAGAVLAFRARAESLLVALTAQAREDVLTGLPNRRAFDDALASLSALSHRTGEPLSLLAVDVDLFKEVNDARGHAAGDQVLRAVASALRRTGREADVVARTGGDEFSMLLPSCSLEDAIGIALALRELVIAHTARIGPPVTVSVGVATMPASATTPEGLMAAADDALYADKVARRDGELVRPD